MDCDKSFSKDYMLLRPEGVGLVDLCRLLSSKNISDKSFIESPDQGRTKEEDEEEEGETDQSSSGESFQRRRIIFISIFAQKLLLSASTPLSWVGSNIEHWLNLVSCNNGVRRLLLNAIRGNVVHPNKDAANFLSFTGNLDKRVEFDSKIRPGDERYFEQLAMMASKASYENKAYLRKTVTEHWKMEFVETYDCWNDYQDKPSTQFFMMHDKSTDMIVVAFRGTETFNAYDWCSDVDISWYELPGMGKMHGGFMKALGLQKNLGWPKEVKPTDTDQNNSSNPRHFAYYTIREKLRTLCDNNDRLRYIVTGHSLGGALAALFPAILALHQETKLLERLEGVYTFGQPRVGNEAFGKFMQKYMTENHIRYLRFVYSNDIVPRLPYDDSTYMFKHFGTCCYFDSHYKEKILPEEPNKNYYSPLNAIPMMGNAIYELIRSFTIASKVGPEYKETSVLRILRIIGLLFPGIPAHAPMDYNNSIRLGHSENGSWIQ